MPIIAYNLAQNYKFTKFIIVGTIKMCGQQIVPIRGHRDYAKNQKWEKVVLLIQEIL